MDILEQSMCINEEILYAFGGVAKRKNYFDFSSLSGYAIIENLCIILDDLLDCLDSPPYYGDDPNDHEMIKWGVQLYRNDYNIHFIY